MALNLLNTHMNSEYSGGIWVCSWVVGLSILVVKSGSWMLDGFDSKFFVIPGNLRVLGC